MKNKTYDGSGEYYISYHFVDPSIAIYSAPPARGQIRLQKHDLLQMLDGLKLERDSTNAN